MGQLAENIFELTQFLNAIPSMRDNKITTITIRTRHPPILMAEARPLWSPSGLWLGFLINLNEPVPSYSSMSEAARLVITKQQQPASADSTLTIIGSSLEAQKIRSQATAFAQTASTVLITGESGTGKERVARALHAEGKRASAPFIPVNCGAFSGELIQSELFGYAPGAFTGADKKGRAGLFQQANGGILFLDEIAELPLRQQANLLRVLEEKKFTRVGGNDSISVNVKIVVATNRDLKEEVEAGRFREDLYHRLNVMVITLPPLRDRPEDILPISEFHLNRLIKEMYLPSLILGQEVKAIFRQYQWPGNVRALINALEYICNQYFLQPFFEITPEHLPSALKNELLSIQAMPNLKSTEKEAIKQAMENFNGNVTKAAKSLGIGRNTLYAKIKKYELLT
jgi:transcriptional regulator with PAS, ATPase and Fis domain